MNHLILNYRYNYYEYTPNDYYHGYQRLGNLTVLPCKTLPDTKTSINTWKARAKKDYMFPFMKALEKAYAEKDKALDENSESYEKLELEKYVSAPEINKDTIDEYRPIIRKFVREAKRFIDNRSKRIVQKLVEKYPDLT